MHETLDAALIDLDRHGLRRRLTPREATGGVFVANGRRWINFSSNDYLNLANAEGNKLAAIRAVERWGCSATASRLMAGNLAVHEELESELARWHGREAAVVFGCGYLANLGIFSALADRETAIVEDRLNHASLLDGARLSGARLFRYRHAEPEALETLLRRHAGRPTIVATESVFSMDGDVAPVDEIAKVCARYGARCVIDEAHAVGVLSSLPPAGPDTVTVGTLSKALGSYGGFVLGTRALIDWLVNKARSFIYSTALPPSCAASALCSIQVLRADGGAMGRELLRRAGLFRERLREADLDTGLSTTHIVPVIVGSNARALDLAARLSARGILATAIRPPTVPQGAARVRFSITLAHDEAVLDEAAARIVDEFGKLGEGNG